MFKFLLYKLGQFLVNYLPAGMAYRIARFLSDLQYTFSFRDRRAVYNNLSIITHDSSANLKRLTRDVFRNFGIYLIEFFRMRKMVTPEFIEQRIRLHNIQYMNEVKARHRGGIFLTAHLGNWELGGAVIASLGHKMMAVALAHKERPVNDLFNQQREDQGIMVVPVSQAIRRCMETLKNNGLVALVGDRDFNLHGELLDFLGRKAIIPRGPAVLSLRSGAPIIPVFLTREQDGTFDLHICEPIYPPEDKIGHDNAEAMLNMIKQYLSVIESFIRKYPDQWLMFRKFWVEE